MSAEPASPPPALFQNTARWFERAKSALLDTLSCRQGCHHCCVGLFSVTLLDQQEIQRGLRSLPSVQRLAIQQNAVRQVAMLTASAPQLAQNRFIDHWPDRDSDNLAEQYSELPCPALASDGTCSLYAFRPLACRSMGVPSEADGVVHGACAIQTFVPVIRLSKALRQQEDLLANVEAEHVGQLRQQQGAQGEELWLPYAFLSDDDLDSDFLAVLR